MSNDTPLPLRVPRDRRDAWAARAGADGITLSELLRRGAEVMMHARDLRAAAELRSLSQLEATVLKAMDPEIETALGYPLTSAPSKRRQAAK